MLTIELIEALDRILFYPNASKMDDDANVKIALVCELLMSLNVKVLYCF